LDIQEYGSLYDVRIMTTAGRLSIIALVLFGAVFMSCGRDSDQEQFEREAFRPPENITRTNAAGEILSNDPDDWRIAPLFQGYVEINQPPFPNPSTGTVFTKYMLITGLDAVYGMQIYTRDELGRPYLIFEDNQRPLPPGFTEIIIEPARLSRSGLYSAAVGLHRIFIYDGNNNLISFGDLKVE
jgi:hypothetical protein